jgi:hypothetical protein
MALGLLATALAAGLGWRRALQGCATFCLGWGLAFAASWGWWGWSVWQRYGNPVYPFMNHVFASPWAPPLSMEDERFMPRSLAEALAYPFFWLRGRAFVVAETGVADPRFALAWLAVLALAIRALWGWVKGRPRILPPGATLLLSFIAIAFLLWQVQFSILRYIIALEALTGAVLLVTAAAFGWTRMQRFLLGFATLGLVVVVVSEKQNWGRLRQYGEQVIELGAPALPHGAVVATASKPIAFVLPLLEGRNLAFVGLEDVAPRTHQWDETKRLLNSGRPVHVLFDPAHPGSVANIAAFGLVVQEAACTIIRSNLQAGLHLCPAAPE